MSTFIPDDKGNLIGQLNALNNAEVPLDNVIVSKKDNGQTLTGMENYTGSVDVAFPVRSFRRLFPNGAIIKTDLSVSLTSVQALALVNEKFNLELLPDYFTDVSMGERLSSGTDAYVNVQFALVAKPDNPFWTGTLFISLYDKTPEQMPVVEINSWNTLQYIKNIGPTNGINQQHVLNTSDTVYTVGVQELLGKNNWFVLLSVAPKANNIKNVKVDWGFFQPLNDGVFPPSPSLVYGERQYFMILTFNRGATWYIRQLTETEALTNPLQSSVNWAISAGTPELIAKGHEAFLSRNTGAIVDPVVDHFVLNAQKVLVNNRHYSKPTRMEGQPDGDATTEGQSLLILGATVMGDAMGSDSLKALATQAYDAYLMAFYAGEAPPTEPGRWIANWIVNGKQPVLAHYPLAAANEFPTHGGFHATEVVFTNGVGQLAHGTPTFGEYTDLLTQVYIGALGWPNLTADVYVQKEDGSIDWTTKGTVYPIEKVGLRTLQFSDADGTLLGACTAEQVGQITLKDRTVNGTCKVAWAPRVPVEQGGYLIATNECQHNRPIQVPVKREFMGNASDAEQWFCEAAWSLWILTGEEKYGQAFKASRFTIEEYTEIDALDKFFRQVIGTDRYDTDGISYTYTYPSNTPLVINRDAQGYIQTRAEVAAQVYFEQKAIPFRVNRQSILRITYGGKDDSGKPVNFTATLTLSIDKSEAQGKKYALSLPSSDTPTIFDIPVGSLVPSDATDVASDPQSGTPGAGLANYEVPTNGNIAFSSNATMSIAQRANVVDTRTATTLLSTATGASQQFEVKLKKQAPITAIAYRADIPYNIRVSDANGWRWWAMLTAAHPGEWNQLDLTAAGTWKLSSYQPDGTGDKPTSYVPGAGPLSYTILPDDDSAAGNYVEIYCVNALPPADAETPGEAVEDPVTGSMMIDLNKISWSDANTASMVLAADLPDGRTGLVLKCVATATGQQVELAATADQVVREVTYTADIDYNVRVEDADGWRWWVMMPASASWTKLRVLIDDWKLSGYQPNHEDTDTKPTRPNFGVGTKDVVILPDDDSVVDKGFLIYCINNAPAAYNVDDGYTILFNLEADLQGAGQFLIGDCTILNQRQDPLPYTPGLIPFSNNYVPNSPTFDGWHGQPYPGYQHPWVFLDSDNPNKDLMIQNVIQFWVDSQAWYQQKFGIWGPGASAFVWDRWDAPSGSTPNTFTMYHFGNQEAWAGYQPRAFFSAVRLYAGMKERAMDVPEGLVTYISHWLDYLYQFTKDSGGVSPTAFPMESVPQPDADDFTGHMAGLWLAGASLAMLHDFPNQKGYPLARMLFDEIRDHYINNYLVDDVMNGGWSPFGDSANLGKDGMFYGFWSGEILRGLGYYRMLLANHPSTLVAWTPQA